MQEKKKFYIHNSFLLRNSLKDTDIFSLITFNQPGLRPLLLACTLWDVSYCADRSLYGGVLNNYNNQHHHNYHNYRNQHHRCQYHHPQRHHHHHQNIHQSCYHQVCIVVTTFGNLLVIVSFAVDRQVEVFVLCTDVETLSQL